jgi:MoxR-like ATPase
MAKNKKLEVVEVSSRKSPLQEIRSAIKGALQERDHVIDAVMTGVLAKENVFLLGPPGTAKSLSVELFSKAIGGNYFFALMGKTTTPDELFGPVKISALREDRLERNTTNKLPEAHLGFLDEVFKASSAVLNATLTLMNERTFVNGGKAFKTPIMSIFGASNELPQAEELAALYDRFSLRVLVERIQDEDNFEALISGGANAAIPTITLEELAVEQEQAARVTLSSDLIAMIVSLRHEIHQEGIYVSDRKWMQSVRIIKAFAHLNGHTDVMVDDLEILESVLWSTPEQQRIIRRLINRVTNPIGEQIVKVTDGVQELMDQVKAMPDDEKRVQYAQQVQAKVRSGRQQLEKLGDPASNSKLKAAIDKLLKQSASLQEMCM